MRSAFFPVSHLLTLLRHLLIFPPFLISSWILRIGRKTTKLHPNPTHKTSSSASSSSSSNSSLQRRSSLLPAGPQTPTSPHLNPTSTQGSRSCLSEYPHGEEGSPVLDRSEYGVGFVDVPLPGRRRTSIQRQRSAKGGEPVTVG